MEQFIRNIKENINKEIQSIESEESNIFQQSVNIITFLKKQNLSFLVFLSIIESYIIWKCECQQVVISTERIT